MNYHQKDNGIYVPIKDLITKGRYHGVLIREGKVIDEWEDNNVVTNEGINSILNVYFGGATQITAWYLGLFGGNYTPVATDTAATFSTSASESTIYTASTRQAWVAPSGGASGQSTTNTASRAAFTFNAAGTIYGAFLQSSAVISGLTGVLVSAAQFSSPKTVAVNDQLLLSYTFSGASA